MCGFTGFVGNGNESDLRKMLITLKHRGPDAQDIYYQGGIGLGHARLSILDLSAAANQPFFNEDRSVAIIFNGEIYNYKQLTLELQQLHRFKFHTHSDTEVLLYLYEAFGEEAFNKLNGMFACAIYDFKKKSLVLAKDRMGKKPLYYGLFNGTLIFSSEVKAILQHPFAQKEINIDAVNEYLTFEYIPTPNSIFRNIYKLEPGSYLIFQDQKILKKEPFWKIQFTDSKISFNDAKYQLGELLNNAVHSRLISDVPLGVFLSGGLDSSTIAYYAQKNSIQKIKTFCIGFEDASYDEANYAKLVANHLGTDHHTEYFKASHLVDLIPEVYAKLDEPLADPSILPTYLLSKFTRQHVTVALGGDGSDELLAGYPTFISNYLIPIISKLPSSAISTFKKLASSMPVRDNNMSLDFKINQFLKGFEESSQYTHTLWLGSFTPRDKENLFTDTTRKRITNGNGLKAINNYLLDASGETNFHQLLYIYYRTYLLEDILVKLDRASMFCSLEARSPFLDYTVVEFVNGLPDSYKLKGLQGKYILKSLMREKIPNEIIDRPKKGFGIPLSHWLRNELKGLCCDLLSKDSLAKHGLFEHIYIEKILNEHFTRKKNHRKLIWTLLTFQLWYKNYF
jgi:asparagine synthase (glutamine-hydrolysing)